MYENILSTSNRRHSAHRVPLQPVKDDVTLSVVIDKSAQDAFRANLDGAAQWLFLTFEPIIGIFRAPLNSSHPVQGNVRVTHATCLA